MTANMHSRKLASSPRGVLAAAALLLLAATAVAAAPSLHDHAPTQDPYKVLGVRRSATQREITQAFRRLSRQWHPDKSAHPDATTRFQQISAAYDALSDPSKQAPWQYAAQGGPARPPPFSRDWLLVSGMEAVHIVMDLDPVRVWQLSVGWLQDWASTHSTLAQPLWRGRADAVVCWGLGQAWRAPQLVELLAPSKRQLSRALGPWRAWRVSGALLELSAWASSQPLCLAAHTYLHTAAAAAAAAAASSAAAANEDAAAAEDGAAAAAAAAAGSDAASSSRHAQQAAVLAKLQQQLDVRRRARQQALEQHQRRQRRRQQKQQQHPGRGQEAHSTSADDGASHDEPPQSQLRGATRASQAQAAALWVLLLGGVSCLLLRRRDRLLLAAGAAAVAGALCGVGSRLLLPDEASVGQLAALLATDTPQSGLVKLWFLSASLAGMVLAPLAAAGALALLLTWVWAAVSCVGFAMTLCLSQLGIAAWLALQAWGLTGGGAPINSTLVAAALLYLLYRRPAFGLWWLRNALSPALLLLHFVKDLLLAALTGSSSYTRAATAAAAADAHALAEAVAAHAALAATVAREAQQARAQQAAAAEQGSGEGRGCGAPAAAGAAQQAAAGPVSLQGSDARAAGGAEDAAISRRRDDAPAAGGGSEQQQQQQQPPTQQQQPPTQQQQAQQQQAQQDEDAQLREQRTRWLLAQGPHLQRLVEQQRRQAGEAAAKQASLFPPGPWWPGSFSPPDLAATCHFYSSVVAWRCALRALGVAAASCKLTVWLALATTAAAACGVPLPGPSLKQLVQGVLLRGGVALALLPDVLRLLRQRE